MQEVAKGLTFEVAQEGSPLTTEQRTEMEAAIRRLEASEGALEHSPPPSHAAHARGGLNPPPPPPPPPPTPSPSRPE